MESLIPVVAALIFGLGSELIALNPKWKSNGWIQLAMNVFEALAQKGAK